MNLKNIAFWFMLIIVIALSIYVLYWTKTESFKCVNNPGIYMIDNLEKSNLADVTCTCSVLKENGMSVLLTNKGFSAIQPRVNSSDVYYFNTSFSVKA